MPASSRISRPSSALVPSRRMTIGARRSTRPIASTMPLATSSPRVMPPKMLMRIDWTFSSKLMTSSAPAMTSAFAPPPMSRKLAAEPPTWLTTSSVLIARPAPLAMMPTVPSRPMYCRSWFGSHLLALVDLGEAPEFVPLGVTELGVLVECDLGVECVNLTGRLQDQRVDLGEVAVPLGEAAVQLHEDVGDTVECSLGQFRVDTCLTRSLPRRGRRPGRCGA